MANTIDQAFIKQFESEVHLAYQRMGSKLMNTVRNVSNVAGSVVRFQKIGTGSASTKSRNGMVTPMELDHTNVEATLADYYAAEYIDKLDELKTNIDERQAIATSAAAALGRKTDEILITAMDAGANSTQLHDRYIAMHPKGFADLFLINEFASSDYVGDQNLPYAGGMTMKEFLGFKIFSTTAVTAGKNMAYHTTAVGLGIGANVTTELNYVPERVSHLATSMMSMGAVVIDDNGIYELLDNNT
jgi:hypothetical protein